MGSAPPAVSTSTVIVVLPGDAGPAPLPSALVPDDATVIGIDAGVDHAFALGLAVDLAVGDFDSVSAAGLDRLRAAGGRVERHPEAKDQTDFELGLAAATAAGASRIVVVGGRGGRLDHALANLLVLADPALAAVEVSAVLDGSVVTVVRRTASLRDRPGALVSLVAVGGPAVGVATEGLRYPLTGEELSATAARGVSNVFLGEEATVSLVGGVLLAIQPDSRPSPGDHR